MTGIKIFKFEAPLYFANVENFKSALMKETSVNPYYLKQVKARMKDTDQTLRHNEVSCLCHSGLESRWSPANRKGYMTPESVSGLGKFLFVK